MKNPVQSGEDERLAALHAYGVLDTPPEKGFDRITALAARLFGVPITAITLIDAERQWFKSVRGLDVREIPRDASLCAHAMWNDEVTVVPDATLDRRFADNPLVKGEPGLRFYAGARLRSPEGHPLGALCLSDVVSRDLAATERRALADLASLVEDELLLRRLGRELQAQKIPGRPTRPSARSARRLKPATRRPSRRPSPPTEAAPAVPGDSFRQLVDDAGDAFFVYDLEGRFVDANATACRMVGYGREELLRLRVGDLEVSFDPRKTPQRWQDLAPGEAATVEGFNRRGGGGVFASEARITAVETAQGRFLLALVRDVSERKRAERSLQKHAVQQRAINQLGARALSETTVANLLEDAVKLVAGTLDVEICQVLEHLPGRGEFVARAAAQAPGRDRAHEAAATFSDSMKFAAGRALHRGEVVIVQDAGDDRRFETPGWLDKDAVSGVNVCIGGDATPLPLFGVLAVYSRRPREFTEDDLLFVQGAANLLAVAIARLRAVEALRTVEARYQRIAANTPGVVYQCVHKPDGTLSVPFISEGCRALYGREPEEIEAAPNLLWDTVHPVDRPGLERGVRTSVTGLTPLHWHGRHLLPGGEVRWVRFDARPERLPDGSVICDGIIIDVTGEERRKEALRQSEERFRLATFHSPFPIMLHADDDEVLQVNDAWTHLTGYLPEQLGTVEKWLALACATEPEREEVRRFLESVWDHVGAVTHRGLRIRCADGEERIWDVSGVNLGRLPDGRWLRLAAAADVTDRHQQETALREAKEEAERANTAKSRFLSRMSHELRTPLNAILGFGQVLVLGQLGEQETQAVQHILKGGHHLLGMIDEVLDLARVEAGEMGLRLAAVPLNKLLSECAAFVTRMAKARAITCAVEVSPTCHRFVQADEQRLRQVLLNLLSNAIKYNREGGRVSLGCEERAAGRVRVNVRDTGPGIPPEGMARLFVPFERLGQEYGEVEGTGLGLVVARQLVEAMGGRLDVESEVGQGSTFSVELPTAETVPPAPLPVDPLAAPAADGRPQGKPAVTVLYVEDNLSNLQVVQTVLERLRPHWRFLSTRDGVNGLRLARKHLPDIMLLDLQLPGLNGDEVLTTLRADPRTRFLRVLLLSADATAHSRDRLLALGATDYLPKPFKVSDLLEKLDTLAGDPVSAA